MAEREAGLTKGDGLFDGRLSFKPTCISKNRKRKGEKRRKGEKKRNEKRKTKWKK